MKKKQPHEKLIIGIDIGGTKIALALISLSGEIRKKSIFPTPQIGPEKSFIYISKKIEEMLDDATVVISDTVGIGIGIAAALETETDIILWAPNLKGWVNIDLKGYLEKKFRVPVAIEYDGHTAVLGEYWRGAGKGSRNLVDIIIGTGIGAGFIIDGHLIRGANRLAGAVGWQIIDNPTKRSEKNDHTNGFWESCCSGIGIASYAKRILANKQRTSFFVESEEITAKLIYAMAKQGDPDARQILDQVAEWIGIGLANIVSTLNPEKVILGGSVGQASEFLLDRIIDVINMYAQPQAAKTVSIETSSLGTDAGLLGAAYGIILRLKEVNRKR